MHAFTVIDESVLDVMACAGLCMMTGDGMVARDGMAAEVAWQQRWHGSKMAWWPEMVARWHGGQRWQPDGMVARDGGQMAWWPEMAARWHSGQRWHGGQRWQFYLAQKNAGPVHIFWHASIVVV